MNEPSGGTRRRLARGPLALVVAPMASGDAVGLTVLLRGGTGDRWTCADVVACTMAA